MPLHLSPLSATLLIGSRAFPALSFSEAGLTLPPSAADALRGAGRGERLAAVLRLDGGTACDHYPVVFRVASRGGSLVEVALVELPPQARLRMRHASKFQPVPDMEDDPIEEVATTAPGGRWQLTNGHRLILGESRSVWALSQERHPAPLIRRVTPVLTADELTRAYTLWVIGGLAAGSVFLIVLAALVAFGA